MLLARKIEELSIDALTSLAKQLSLRLDLQLDLPRPLTRKGKMAEAK